MTAAQVAFLVGLTVALATSIAFAGLVIGSAMRGGRAGSLRLAGHRTEHGALGRVAFLVHRVTGFAIFSFLCLHILDVGLFSISRGAYDAVQRLYGSAPLRVFECGLLFAILFHTCNGLRLLVLDLAPSSSRWSRRMLEIAIALSSTGGVAGSVLILAPLIR
jgi:succinate dehydrogenase / fumarate reductase cytochrome b subunit